MMRSLGSSRRLAPNFARERMWLGFWSCREPMVKIPPRTASTGATSKALCIEKFKEWWSVSELSEVISRVNPEILAILAGHGGDTLNHHKLAEILYDSVGAHFLRNVENSTQKRRNFLREVFQAAIAVKQIRKEDIVEAAKDAVRSDKKSSIKGIQDVISHNATHKLCLNLAKELGLPSSVAEKEHAESKPDTEVVEPHVALNPLYDYQYTTGLFLRGMLEGTNVDEYDSVVKRKMIAVPTGSGKTRLVVETLIEWLNDGKPSKNRQQRDSKFILWIAQSSELCEQAFSTFRSVFESIGRNGTTLRLHRFWGAGSALPTLGMDDLLDERGVIVATIQSLLKPPAFQLEALSKITSCIVVDEAHHATAESYSKVLRKMDFNWNNRKTEISERGIILIGLTATPFRGTGDNAETLALERRLNGVYFPTIPYASNIKNFKPHALVDCQTFAYAGEYVRIQGERSYDRDGFINDEDYFWKITKHNGLQHPTFADHKTDQNDWTYVGVKNVKHKFAEQGEYTITLKVIDNEGESDTTHAQIYIDELPKTHRSHEKRQKDLYRRLIKRKILCKVYHKILPSKPVELDEEDAKHLKRYGEFGMKTIGTIGRNIKRNTIILEEIHKLRELGRKKILFFGCSVNHSRQTAVCLRAMYGIKAQYVDSKMDIDYRLNAIEQFRAGDLEVLCNFDVLTTGFDAPNIDCVFVGRPVKSTLLYTQMIGRGMRGTKSKGTDDVLIVDIDDNFQLKYIHDSSMTKLGWKIFQEYWEPWEKPASRRKSSEIPQSTKDDTDSYLSHCCSQCKRIASGIAEIQEVFGIVGPAQILIDCLKNMDYSAIPQECEQCRREKMPTSEKNTWSYLVANL